MERFLEKKFNSLLKNYLFYEREFNYFPEYLGYKDLITNTNVNICFAYMKFFVNF